MARGGHILPRSQGRFLVAVLSGNAETGFAAEARAEADIATVADGISVLPALVRWTFGSDHGARIDAGVDRRYFVGTVEPMERVIATHGLGLGCGFGSRSRIRRCFQSRFCLGCRWRGQIRGNDCLNVWFRHMANRRFHFIQPNQPPGIAPRLLQHLSRGRRLLTGLSKSESLRETDESPARARGFSILRHRASRHRGP